MTNSRATPSLDIASQEFQERLVSFLRTHWDAPVEVSNLRRFPSGMSWTTIGFTAHVGEGVAPLGNKDLILRLGDPAGILAPYRAEPEFQALTALADIPKLPIPRAYAYSEDSTILGAPFIISQWVQGDTPRPFEGAEDARDDGENLSLAHDFVDALSALHLFDWSRTPLAEQRVEPQDVARRETRYWANHIHLMNDDASPQMRYAMHWLEANAPVADRITIVHGDYRVGNFLRIGGHITAILDWELVHLGDPHEDLAWAGLRVYAARTSRIGGLVERSDFYERYHASTGFTIRPDVIRYYEVLGQFKLAAMFIGAVQRVEAGKAKDVRMAAIGLHLAPMLLELNRLLEAAS